MKLVRRLIARCQELPRETSRVFGPIFQIETLIVVRRARYYLLRAAYAALLLFILWVNYAETYRHGSALTLSAAAEFASSFFYSFAVVQLIVAAVVTAAVTAGMIAEERERRTIEYLFATDLSNSEIVLGKLAARLLLVMVFLLSGLPVLSLASLFGGIDAEQLLQITVATASTVTLSGAISLLVSVLVRRPRDAIMRAFVVLLGLTVLPWLSLFFAFWRPAVFNWIQPLVDPLMVGNPFLLLAILAESRVPCPTSLSPGWIGVFQLIRNQGLLWLVVLACAVWRLRRAHTREAVSVQRGPRASYLRRLFRPQLGNNAMLWKELFAEPAVVGIGIAGRVIVGLLFLAVLAPIATQLIRTLQGTFRADDFREMVATLCCVIASLYLLVVAARAASAVTAEKERQTWDTILGTPLSAWEIISGKTLGSLFAMRWILVLYGIMWGMVVIVHGAAIGPAVFMSATVAVLSPFFASLGVYMSLRSRTSTRAMCWSLILTLVMGGGYLLIMGPLMEAFASSRWMRSDQRDATIAFCAPALIAWAGIEEVRHPPRALSPKWFATGVALYIAAGAFLFFQNVAAFDRLAGRPQRFSPRRTVRHGDADLGRIASAAAEQV